MAGGLYGLTLTHAAKQWGSRDKLNYAMARVKNQSAAGKKYIT
jgi:hypothetical protein